MEFPEKYKPDIEKAISILKQAGCSEIYIFGSLAEGTAIRSTTDIDIAIKGLEKSKFFEVYGMLMLSLNHSVDLITLDEESRFVKNLREQGSLSRVA